MLSVTGGESYDAGDGVVYRIASEGDNSGKVVQVAADGKEFRPVDLSITKDVAALIVAALIVLSVMLSLVRYYKRNGMKAPRKGMGAVEALIGFIYDGVLKNTLGEKAPKFAGFGSNISRRRQSNRQYSRDACSCRMHVCRDQHKRQQALLERHFLA